MQKLGIPVSPLCTYDKTKVLIIERKSGPIDDRIIFPEGYRIRRETYRRKIVMENTNVQTPAKGEAKETTSIQFLTITAIFVALTYVFTAFINVRLPIAANGGLIHLGNVPLFIGAIIFGKKTGMIAGGVGMGLFDLLSGWTAWAPFTLIIVGIMGYAVGKITESEKHQKFSWYVVAIAVACVIKVVGYYIAEVILYGNFVAPLASVPGNLVQIGVAAVIVLIVVGRLNVAAKRIGLKK